MKIIGTVEELGNSDDFLKCAKGIQTTFGSDDKKNDGLLKAFGDKLKDYMEKKKEQLKDKLTDEFGKTVMTVATDIGEVISLIHENNEFADQMDKVQKCITDAEKSSPILAHQAQMQFRP